MTTTTSNYGWVKPDVGASNDAWGGLLNTDLDGIDSTVKTVSNVANAALPLAGGTLTGNLTVAPASGAAGLSLAKAASGQMSFITGYTGPVAAANARWQMRLGDTIAEAAGNAGSDFSLSAYDNSGAFLAFPLTIERKTGYVAVNGIGATLSAASAAASQSAAIRLNKGGSGYSSIVQGMTNGVLRWALALGDVTAEGGSNTGSDLTISSWSDAGANLASPLAIKRSTGVTTFSVAIVNGPSDRRLKENIAPLEGSLDKVLALQGVSFNLIATPNLREIGLIAQDVAPIVPEILQTYAEHDAEGREIEGGRMMALDYPKLTALLIEAVKTLAARVQVLETAGGR
jgi:hypothetical protein